MPSLTLHDVLLYELADLLDAEEQLLAALPRWTKSAESAALRNHLEEEYLHTQQRIARLQEAFAAMGIAVHRTRCAVIRHAIEEVARALRANRQHDDLVRNALLHYDHYALAGYGAASTFASIMGGLTAAQLLHRNFAEEERREKVFSS